MVSSGNSQKLIVENKIYKLRARRLRGAVVDSIPKDMVKCLRRIIQTVDAKPI
jgi:hypothetical protein